jgi:DNA-binding transcriptional ArsR family regulator
VDRSPPPPLLPIFRSQQQAELLALLLGDPEVERSLSEISNRSGVPYASVHREVERAEAAGLLTSRRVGRTRLVRADTASPYYPGLSDVLTRAFGAPRLLAEALRPLTGIEAAYLFGSWAARFQGENGMRPVGDIDLLVLGELDRDALYEVVAAVEAQLGRPVQITVRPPGWLEAGSGTFHDTVAGRPLVRIPLRQPGSSGSEG